MKGLLLGLAGAVVSLLPEVMLALGLVALTGLPFWGALAGVTAISFGLVLWVMKVVGSGIVGGIFGFAIASQKGM